MYEVPHEALLSERAGHAVVAKIPADCPGDCMGGIGAADQLSQARVHARFTMCESDDNGLARIRGVNPLGQQRAGSPAGVGEEIPIDDVCLPRLSGDIAAAGDDNSRRSDPLQHRVHQAPRHGVRLAQDHRPPVEVDPLHDGAARRLPAHSSPPGVAQATHL